MRDNRGRGFSIIELLVVLVLIALLIAIAVPSINGLLGLALGENSRKLQGLVKDVYTKAALSGQTYRIVFDIDSHSLWVEESTSRILLEKGSTEVEANVAGSNNAKQRPAFTKVEGELGQAWVLPGSLRIRGVWTEHLRDRQRDGKVYQYFFPGGQAESAQITLGEEGEDFSLTIVVEPLTGNTYISETEPPLPIE